MTRAHDTHSTPAASPRETAIRRAALLWMLALELGGATAAARAASISETHAAQADHRLRSRARAPSAQRSGLGPNHGRSGCAVPRRGRNRRLTSPAPNSTLFGPSSARSLRPCSAPDEALRWELAHLGKDPRARRRITLWSFRSLQTRTAIASPDHYWKPRRRQGDSLSGVCDTALAEAFIAGARSEAQGTTVRNAIDAFVERKRKLGRADATVESAEDRLLMLLGPIANPPAPRGHRSRSRTLRRSSGVSDRAPTRWAPPRRGHTSQCACGGQGLGAWWVKQRWLKSNPFAEVEAVGAKVLGADKPQHTIDESRRLRAYCHMHAERDQGAVLTLAYLLLEPRASELVCRDVRDLDDNGRQLRIGKTKSKAGRRNLLVPDELIPLMLRVAGGRVADAPLFARPDGRRWSRFVARDHVRRICRAAGVSELPPQALRRTQASLATAACATGLAVARHLGHAVGEAPAVTGRAYVGRDAAAAAHGERAFRALQRGRR